jgi:transposase
MARPAQVFARPLRARERAWLRSLRRRGGEFASPVTVRRAQVIDMSRRHYSAPEIAEALDATADWVRGVVHEFNDIGLEALLPAWGGGRPRQITGEMRARIVEVVDSHPQELGEPYVTWSLRHLRMYLMRTGMVRAISKERLRQILSEEGRPTQSTKGWKHSPDPDFQAKAARLRRLYRAAESGHLDGVLVCFDEHGPVTPRPSPAEAGGREVDPDASGPTTESPTAWPTSLVFTTWARTRVSPVVPAQGRRPRDLCHEDDPGPLPAATHLGPPGQPLLALDQRGAGHGPGASHHPRAHAHLRQLAEPHRVPLRGDGEGGRRRL